MLCFVADLSVVNVGLRGCAFDLLSLLGAVERWFAENHVSARRNVPTKYQNRRLMRSMRDGDARKHLLYISRGMTILGGGRFSRLSGERSGDARKHLFVY